MSFPLEPTATTASTGDIKRLANETNEFGVTINANGSTVLPTAITVSIEGELANSGFYLMVDNYAFTAAEITAGLAHFDIIGKSADKLRYVVDALTGGTDPNLKFTVK